MVGNLCIFLALYIDYMIFIAKSKQEIIKLKSLLSNEFEMKDLGDAKKILGIEIHHDEELVNCFCPRKGILRRYWRGLEFLKPCISNYPHSYT